MIVLPGEATYLYIARAELKKGASVERWSDWYDHEHIPDLLRVPGLSSSGRYTDPADKGISLAVYEVESPAVFDQPEYTNIAGWGPWAPAVASYERAVYRVTRAFDDFIPTAD